MNKKLVVLIYKRTHKNDPRESGIFGIEDCMKSVREWNYDAVIGIGGKCPWTNDKDIAKKINWIGVTPHKHPISFYKHKVVTFEKFCLFEEKGPYLEDVAPKLSDYLYNSRCRFIKSTSLSDDMYSEVLKILEIVNNINATKLTTKEVEKYVSDIFIDKQCLSKQNCDKDTNKIIKNC